MARKEARARDRLKEMIGGVRPTHKCAEKILLELGAFSGR